MRIIYLILFLLSFQNHTFAQSAKLDDLTIRGEKQYEILPVPDVKSYSYKTETLVRKVPTIRFMVRAFSPNDSGGYKIITLTRSNSHLWQQRDFCQTGMVKDGDGLVFINDYTSTILTKELADPFLVSLIEKFGPSVFSFVIRKEQIYGISTEAIMIQALNPMKQQEWQEFVAPIKKFIGEYFQVNVEFGREEEDLSK